MHYRIDKYIVVYSQNGIPKVHALFGHRFNISIHIHLVSPSADRHIQMSKRGKVTSDSQVTMGSSKPVLTQIVESFCGQYIMAIRLFI